MQATVRLRSIYPYVFVARFFIPFHFILIAFFPTRQSLPHFNTKTNNSNHHSPKFDFILVKYLVASYLSCCCCCCCCCWFLSSFSTSQHMWHSIQFQFFANSIFSFRSSIHKRRIEKKNKEGKKNINAH